MVLISGIQKNYKSGRLLCRRRRSRGAGDRRADVGLILAGRKCCNYAMASPSAPSGKNLKIQGITVLASRKPKLGSRVSVEFERRVAERTSRGIAFQLPPRKTRRVQLPLFAFNQAEPSVGAYT